jgi:hypothetical protein
MYRKELRRIGKDVACRNFRTPWGRKALPELLMAGMYFGCFKIHCLICSVLKFCYCRRQRLGIPPQSANWVLWVFDGVVLLFLGFGCLMRIGTMHRTLFPTQLPHMWCPNYPWVVEQVIFFFGFISKLRIAEFKCHVM